MSSRKTFDFYLASKANQQTPDTCIEYLRQCYGEDIFQRLLNSLLNSNLSMPQATELWQAAMQNFSKDSSRMNWRAVILDYLVSHTELLQNPCFIECEELEQLRKEAVSDKLTKLYDQAHIKQLLSETIEKYRKNKGSAFSFLIFSTDHFKQLNQRCGFQYGDQVLKKISAILNSQLPANGLAVRYGSKEFAVVLPDANLPQAIHWADSIRSQVADTVFSKEDRLDSGKITISGGVACYPTAGTSSDLLMAHANNRLDDAKISQNCIFPRTNDTRSELRHRYSSIVEIFPPAAENFQHTLSTDISSGGALLKSPLPAAIGSRLKLRFPYPFWPNRNLVDGEVRHVRNNSQRGTFLLGVQFLQPQTNFLQELLTAEVQNDSA